MDTTRDDERRAERIGEALRGRIEGDVLVDRISLTAYATAACIYRILPLAVVVPKEPADVASAVRAAGELGAAVIARGAGSGLAVYHPMELLAAAIGKIRETAAPFR